MLSFFVSSDEITTRLAAPTSRHASI